MSITPAEAEEIVRTVRLALMRAIEPSPLLRAQAVLKTNPRMTIAELARMAGCGSGHAHQAVVAVRGRTRTRKNGVGEEAAMNPAGEGRP